MILNNVKIDAQSLLKSQELSHSLKNQVITNLGLNPMDVTFHYMQKKIGKIEGSFFTSDQYISVFFDKKGNIKKESRQNFSDLSFERMDPKNLGLAYKIKYFFEENEWDFKLTFSFKENEITDITDLKSLVESLKNAIPKSKTKDVVCSDVESIMSGNNSMKSGNKITLDSKRFQKTKEELKKAGTSFLNLAHIADVENLLFCDRFKLLGNRNYYLIKKDGFIILNGVAKDFSEAKNRQEFSFRDIDTIEYEKDSGELNEIDYEDMSISIKVKGNEVCRIYLDLKGFVTSKSPELVFDTEYFKQIITNLVPNSSITLEDTVDKIKNYFSNELISSSLSSDFSAQCKRTLIQSVLLPFFKEKITLIHGNDLIKEVDGFYRNYLVKINGIINQIDISKAEKKYTYDAVIGGVDLEFLHESLSSFYAVNYIKLLILKYLKLEQIEIGNLKEWNLDLLFELKRELDRHKATVIANNVRRNATNSKIVRHKMPTENMKSEEQAISYMHNWCKNKLSGEINKFQV